MSELTLAKAKELLEEAVAEKGADYVYTNREGEQGDSHYSANCYYVHGSQPGCIVGHVLHRAGVPLSRLMEEEGQDAEGALRNLRGDVTWEDDVMDLLQDVQFAQDRGTPWGQAVTQALAELED